MARKPLTPRKRAMANEKKLAYMREFSQKQRESGAQKSAKISLSHNILSRLDSLKAEMGLESRQKAIAVALDVLVSSQADRARSRAASTPSPIVTEGAVSRHDSLCTARGAFGM